MTQKISKLLAGSKTLFLIDDIIADEALNKQRQPLLELAISGCHRNHLLWLLTQSYTAVPNNNNNKKRSHTQLDSRQQVIAFQDRVITINIKEAQHPLK